MRGFRDYLVGLAEAVWGQAEARFLLGREELKPATPLI